MEKFQSLADYLGVEHPDAPSQPASDPLIDITDPDAFCEAVIKSREFRSYIMLGLRLGNLPGFSSILKYVLERHWGKVPDRVEHTGKDGDPIITEVRRVIVRTREDNYPEQEDDVAPKYPTH